MINSFGGKVEVGETPAAGAVRELQEETGIQIPKVECMEDAKVGTLHFTFDSRTVRYRTPFIRHTK